MTPPPLPENGASLANEQQAEIPSGSGSAELPSGSGLPELTGIQWEHKPDGSIEAWLAPVGNNAPRKTKTYLARVGVRLLKQWNELPPPERHQAVADWVAIKRKMKAKTVWKQTSDTLKPTRAKVPVSRKL